MSLLEGEGVDRGTSEGGDYAPWVWLAEPDSSVRRPSDLLSEFGDDPQRWPNDFDIDRLGRISTEQWANDYGWRDTFDGRAEETWGLWATTWPVPIGRRAIFHAFPPSEKHHPAPIADTMPWQGCEYAVFIHSLKLGENVITTLCLVDRHVDRPSGTRAPVVSFTKAGICFVFLGPDPTAPAVLSYVKHARTWWNGYRAPRVGAGRPLGTTARTISGYKAVYRVIFGEELRPPTRDEFVARSDIPESTVKRNLRAWGYTWSSFSAECQETK